MEWFIFWNSSPYQEQEKVISKKCYLLALVDKYYKQANDLPDLQTNSLIYLETSTKKERIGIDKLTPYR